MSDPRGKHRCNALGLQSPCFDRRKHPNSLHGKLVECALRMFPDLLSDNKEHKSLLSQSRNKKATDYTSERDESLEENTRCARQDSQVFHQSQGVTDGDIDTLATGSGNAADGDGHNPDKKEVLSKTGISTGLPNKERSVTRSVTGRLSKRVRSFSPPNSPPPSKKQASAKYVASKNSRHRRNTGGTPETKTRKQWELWSLQDINLFFEALYEHGKDFDAIQNFISQKLKKKDPSCGVRTKDHIRHFYYRTWHRIMKHIVVEGMDDINKQALELYGLVNYGELRKKVGNKITSKLGEKLNELVHTGTAVVRIKSKNTRFRTPVCRALKKLHHIEEPKEEVKKAKKMPERVIVEMYPHSNAAWSRVQMLSQNPRLRVTLRLSKRASSLIEFLNKKWISDRTKMRHSLIEPDEPDTEMKIHIPEDVKLTPLLVKQTHSAPKLEFSFNSYMETRKSAGTDSPHSKKVPKSIFSNLEEVQIQQPSTSTCQSSWSQGLPDQDNQVSSTNEISSQTSTTPDSSKPAESVGNKAGTPDLSTPGESVSVNKEPVQPTVVEETGTKMKLVETPSNILNSIFADESAIPYNDIQLENRHEVSDPKPCVGPVNIPDVLLEGDDDDSSPVDPSNKENTATTQGEQEAAEKFTKLNQGLLYRDCGNMTVAELYMMMGCPLKICLEYEWVKKKIAEDIWELNKKLTNMLRRLVHLATTEFVDFKTVNPNQQTSSPSAKCTCGSSRKNGTPPTNKVTSARSPAVSRLRNAARSPSTQNGAVNSETPKQGTPKKKLKDQGGPPTTPKSSKKPPIIISPLQLTTKLAAKVDDMVPGAIPNAGGDGVFKLPTAMPPRVQQIRPNALGLAERNQFLQQVNMVTKNAELFAPQRTGQRRLQRNARRSLVVQRTLLPKTQLPSRQIMTLAMVPGSSNSGQTASFLPIISSTVKTLDVGGPVTTIANIDSVTATTVSQITDDNTLVSTKAPPPKPRTARRIIPIPVTGTDSNSSLFGSVLSPVVSESSNILRDAVIAANISTSEASQYSLSGGNIVLNTNSAMSASGTGTSMTFSQAFTLGDNRGLSGTEPMVTINNGAVSLASVTGALSDTPLLSHEPPNISSLLDLSVPSISDMSESTDKLIDMALLNSNSSFGGQDVSLSAILNVDDQMNPSKGFKGMVPLGVEDQWLGSDDFSLSNLLHDSPSKKTSTSTVTTATGASLIKSITSQEAGLKRPFMMNESSKDSIGLGRVTSDFEVMQNEDSFDLIGSFAVLAAKMNTSKQDS